MLILTSRPATISPLAYGAVGDGVTDDLVALNACFAAARTAGAVVKIDDGYTFGFNGYAVLRNGCKGMLGAGGTLKALDGPLDTGVLLAGKAQGYESDVTGARIEGIQFDCNDNTVVAFNCQSPRFCVFDSNNIYNQTGEGYAILLRAQRLLDAGPLGNVIKGNVVDAGTSETGFGIAVHGFASFGIYAGAREKWKADFDLGDEFVYASRNIVMDNRVTGGIYGISLLAAVDGIVQRNTLAHNVRNLSCQTRSNRNRILNNDCFGSSSSSIHVAYESCDNLIEDNSIRSPRAEGEGLLQAYVGAKRNAFRRNSTFSDGTAPKYHVYIGLQSDDCVVEDTAISGTCAHAYVAVESAWSSLVENPAHRNYAVGTTDDDLFTLVGMSGVAIRDTTITGTSAVPGIFVSAIDDANGSHTLSVTLSGNTIGGSALPLEEYEMTLGALEVL